LSIHSQTKAKSIAVMKIIRLSISILLVTLATTGYGQILGPECQSALQDIKDRLFPNRDREIRYVTVGYKDEPGMIESWMSEMRSWAIDGISKDAYVTPVITRTFRVDHAEVVFESDLRVEHWMNTPFEACMAEEEVAVEAWMTSPFETAIAEEEVAVEAWMTSPFETAIAEEEVAVEAWMTSPFETAIAEEEVAVEAWMTSPFETAIAEEEVAVEGWMTATWDK
jgi:hypothetical protein